MFFTFYQCVIHFVKEKRGREQIRDAGGALERNDTAVVAAGGADPCLPLRDGARCIQGCADMRLPVPPARYAQWLFR